MGHLHLRAKAEVPDERDLDSERAEDWSVICWVPGCDEDEDDNGCCRKHADEAMRMARLVLGEPYTDRCAEWGDLAIVRRVNKEAAEKEMRQRKAEMQQAKWRLTGRTPDVGDTVGAVRNDLNSDMSAGSRNSALNRAGYRLGRLVGGGVLTRTEAEAILQQAADAHRLPRHEAKYVIARSLDDGTDNPYLARG